MKKAILRILTAIMALTATAPTVQGQMMFDTGRPSKVLQTGVRVGVNTSGLSTNYQDLVKNISWNHNQWRSGFSAGFIVDINFTNFFTIQPGLFYKTFNSGYHYLINTSTQLQAVDGKCGGKYFEVPILASLRMGVAELAQLQLDFGPYFATGFGGKNRYTILTGGQGEKSVEEFKGQSDYFGDDGMLRRSDWGLKTGIGILAMQHFYIGVHYQFSCRNVRKDLPALEGHAKGHNRTWTFSVGYNF